MNAMHQAILRAGALLLVGALLAGCAAPNESRDMGDHSDGLSAGDQPEESAGTSGNNTQGDAIEPPLMPTVEAALPTPT